MYSDPKQTFQNNDRSYEEQEDSLYAHPDYYQVADSAPSPEQKAPTDVAETADAYATEYGLGAQFADPQERERYYAAHAWRQELNGDQEQQYAPYVPHDQPGPEQPVSEQPQESAQGSGVKKKLTGLGGGIVALGAWLLKLKSLAFLLKFGVAGFSAIASVFVYSLLFGWPFAIGLVIMLFLHEMGHALVMKIKGIPLGGLVFVPLLGAAVTMRQLPHNAKEHAEVAIAGPLAGAIVASICLLLAHQYPGTIWAPLAYFGFFINLFNLIPIVPFDGGNVLAAVDRRVWIVGFLMLLGYQIWQWSTGNFNSILLIFVLMAAMQLLSRNMRANADDEQTKAFYTVSLSSRISITVLYFGLAAILFLGMTMAHQLMPALH